MSNEYDNQFAKFFGKNYRKKVDCNFLYLFIFNDIYIELLLDKGNIYLIVSRKYETIKYCKIKEENINMKVLCYAIVNQEMNKKIQYGYANDRFYITKKSETAYEVDYIDDDFDMITNLFFELFTVETELLQKNMKFRFNAIEFELFFEDDGSIWIKDTSDTKCKYEKEILKSIIELGKF